MGDFNFNYSDHEAEEYTSSSFKSKSVDYICQKLEQFLLSAGYLMEGGHIALVRPQYKGVYSSIHMNIPRTKCDGDCSCGEYGSVEITTQGAYDANCEIRGEEDIYSRFDAQQ